LELRGLRSSDRFPGPAMPFQDVEVARCPTVADATALLPEQPTAFPDEKID